MTVYNYQHKLSIDFPSPPQKKTTTKKPVKINKILPLLEKKI